MNIFVHWINEDGGMYYTLHNYDITTITPLFMTHYIIVYDITGITSLFYYIISITSLFMTSELL